MVAFCFNVPFLRMLFLFLYCKLFDLFWLFTPFQMSIGNNKKRKRSIVPTCDTRPPLLPLSLSVPSVAGKKYGNST